MHLKGHQFSIKIEERGVPRVLGIILINTKISIHVHGVTAITSEFINSKAASYQTSEVEPSTPKATGNYFQIQSGQRHLCISITNI